MTDTDKLIEKTGRTPITDEWLSSVDFKWRQNERQPNKHWRLVCNIETPGSRVIEQTSIELQRCGWRNGHGDYVGDPARWMLWVTDTFERYAFIRNIEWQEEVIALGELITGRTWSPETHIYGQAWPEGSRALQGSTGKGG